MDEKYKKKMKNKIMQFLKDFKQLKNDLELMILIDYDIDIDKEQRK